MKFAPLAVHLGILLVGCQPEAPKTESSEKPEATAGTGAVSPKPADEAGKAIEAGMSMADVKKIKGAPKDTRHDHGPNDSELDFWVYDDQTVKFEDGKVVK